MRHNYAQKGYTFFSKIQFTDLDYLYSTPSSCKSKWVPPKTKWPKALFQFLKIITQSNETLFGSTKRQTIAQPFVFKTKFISNQNLKWSGFYAVRKTGRAFRVGGKKRSFATFFPGFRCLTNCISSTAEDRALKLGDRKLKWCMCLHFEYWWVSFDFEHLRFVFRNMFKITNEMKTNARKKVLFAHSASQMIDACVHKLSSGSFHRLSPQTTYKTTIKT